MWYRGVNSDFITTASHIRSIIFFFFLNIYVYVYNTGFYIKLFRWMNKHVCPLRASLTISVRNMLGSCSDVVFTTLSDTGLRQTISKKKE